MMIEVIYIYHIPHSSSSTHSTRNRSSQRLNLKIEYKHKYLILFIATLREMLIIFTIIFDR